MHTRVRRSRFRATALAPVVAPVRGTASRAGDEAEPDADTGSGSGRAAVEDWLTSRLAWVGR